MIKLYTRLHREEQDLRRSLDLEPSRMGPAMGLALFLGITVSGLFAIVCVLALIRMVLS